MKRFFCILIILITVLSLCGCKKQQLKVSKGKIVVACTTFAAYDIVRQVAGDRSVEAVLVGAGADLHSFDPSADDILKIKTCHILVHTGGESDSWALDVERPTYAKSINMLEAVGNNAYYPKGHSEADEHTWMSINNVHVIVKAVSDTLSEIDADGYSEYDDNREQFSLKLNALDKQYKELVAQYKLPSVVVADRLAIAYMLRDYNIVWYAAFSGCSADSEVSFSTITALAKAVDTLKSSYVIVTENGENKIASAVIEASASKSAKTVVVDTMQSATESDSYIDIMTKNLEALKLALAEDTE